VNSYKYFGINLDDKLNFDKHIENVESKTSKGIGVLWKLRQILDEKTLRVIYYALVHPFLYYYLGKNL